MYTYLTMISGPKVGASVLLHETLDKILLGRHADCGIQLEDPLCSRHHAEIWFAEGHWHLRDLSRNGTFVGDQRITEHVLSDGDLVRLGKIELAFHQSEQPPTTVDRLEIGGGSAPPSEFEPEDDQTLQASLSSLSAAALDYKELNRLAAYIFRRIGVDLPDWEHLVLDFLRARLAAARSAWFDVGENVQLIPRRLDPARQPRPELSASLKYLLLGDGRVVWASRQSPADARTAERRGGSDALWAPIALYGEIVGVLYAGLEIGQFRQSHFDLMVAVARLVAVALRLDTENLAYEASRRCGISLAAWPDELPGSSSASEQVRSQLAAAAARSVAALHGEPGAELATVVKLLHACRRESGVPLLVASAEALNAAANEESSQTAKSAAAPQPLPGTSPPQRQTALQQVTSRTPEPLGPPPARPGAVGSAAASLLFSRRLWRLLQRGRGSGAVLWLRQLERLSPAGQQRLLQLLHRAEQSPQASVPIEQQPLAPADSGGAAAMPPRLWLAVSVESVEPAGALLLPELAAALEPGTIRLPPLSERTGDLEPWLDACLETLRREFCRPQLFVNPAARAILLAHRWPGNVAEMQSVLKSAALRSAGDALDVAQAELAGGAAELPYDTLQWSIWEHRLIDAALHQSGGNIAEAARLLGIGRATLYRKLESKDSPAADDD